MRSRNYDYDCVIIGTGIGGLVAGAYMAKQGIKVLLCEHHSQPGGYFTSFTHKGYTFDGGIQACEDMGMLSAVLRQIGVLDRIELRPTTYALASPDGLYPLRSFDQLRKFYDNLIREYPKEAKGIKKIVNDMIAYSQVMEAYCELPNPMFAPFKETMDIYKDWKKKNKNKLKPKNEFFDSMNFPVDEYLGKHILDPNLMRFFRGLMYSGTPAGFLLIFHFVEMNYLHPKGGFQAISDALAEFIIEQGGEIRYKTLVEEILLERGRANGVRLKNGESISAQYVISNGDARRTFLKMLPAYATKESYKQKLRETPVSESGFTVFLGVDMSAEELPVQGCQHIFYVPDYEGIDLSKSLDDEKCYERAPMQISITSYHDPSLAPKGKSSIVLQSVALMDYGNKWRTENGKRGKEYRAFKKKVADQVIANLTAEASGIVWEDSPEAIKVGAMDVA